MKERCSEDDCKVVKQTVSKWIEKEKVIFHQSFDPLNPDPNKRSFVIVM